MRWPVFSYSCRPQGLYQTLSLSDNIVLPYTYPAYRLAHLADYLRLGVKVAQWNQAIRAALVLTAMVEDLVSSNFTLTITRLTALDSAISGMVDDHPKTTSSNQRRFPAMVGSACGYPFNQPSGVQHRISTRTCLLMTACYIRGIVPLMTGTHSGFLLEKLFSTFCQALKIASHTLHLSRDAWTTPSG